MFWRNWSWPARILSMVSVGLVAAILYPVFARSPGRSHGPSCGSNLKQIGLGLLQYTQDYDEKFPPVVSSGKTFGWADLLQPYLKSTQLYQCPTEPNAGQTDPHQSGYVDYWFNARLSKRSLEKVDNPATLLACGDGNDGTDATNARYSLSSLPPAWISDTNSPLFRHNGAANFLFADGHVKSLTPWRVQDAGGVVF